MARARVQVIGHRGAADEAPENTLSAFTRALDLGADGFEFDVQMTSDGNAIVIHDATLDRTTSGRGPVVATSEAEIRSLDAGGWFGRGFAGEGVPSLEAVLALPATIFELELKAWGREALDTVLREVERAGVVDRVKFTGWNQPMLCRLKAERPDASVGLFTHRPEPWMSEEVFRRYVLGTAETAGFDVVHVRASAVTEPIVAGLHDLGCAVHANDAGGTAEVLRAVDAGVDSISTDEVGLAVALIGTDPAQA